jgi:hypothetical protein
MDKADLIIVVIALAVVFGVSLPGESTLTSIVQETLNCSSPGESVACQNLSRIVKIVEFASVVVLLEIFALRLRNL